MFVMMTGPYDGMGLSMPVEVGWAGGRDMLSVVTTYSGHRWCVQCWQCVAAAATISTLLT